MKKFWRPLSLFLALRIPKIQNIPKFLELVIESLILVLLKVGMYAEPRSGRCYYQQLFLRSRKLTRKISTWKCDFNKDFIKKHFHSDVFLGNLQISGKSYCRNTSEWVLANSKIIIIKFR